MNLTQYLESIDERPYRFADRIGVGRPLIYGILNNEKGKGSRCTLLVNAQKIRTASGGLIDLSKLGVPSTA